MAVAAVERSDSVHPTYLHIPELQALIVGDIAYNDVHVNIASTDLAKRLAWGVIHGHVGQKAALCA